MQTTDRESFMYEARDHIAQIYSPHIKAINELVARAWDAGKEAAETEKIEALLLEAVERLGKPTEVIEKEPEPLEASTSAWISVKDLLPYKGQIVIVSDGKHTWDVGMYQGLCDNMPSDTETNTRREKWAWKKNTIKTVWWWMPKDGALPEPPKGENT